MNYYKQIEMMEDLVQQEYKNNFYKIDKNK